MKVEAINVRDIVGKYLKENGYDGLYHHKCERGWGCSMDESNFMSCYNDSIDECEAGHKIFNPESKYPFIIGKRGFGRNSGAIRFN